MVSQEIGALNSEIKLYVSNNFLWFEVNRLTVSQEVSPKHSPVHWGLNSYVSNQTEFIDYTNAFLSKNENAKLKIKNNVINSHLRIYTFNYEHLWKELNFGFSKAPNNLRPLEDEISGEYYITKLDENDLCLNLSAENLQYVKYGTGQYMGCGEFVVERSKANNDVLNEVFISEKSASSQKFYLQLKEVLKGNNRKTNYSISHKSKPLRLYYDPNESGVLSETESNTRIVISMIRVIILKPN